MVAREAAKRKPDITMAEAREYMNSPPSPASMREFEEHLRFDRDDLDTALMGQPDLFYRVSSEYAQAVSHRDSLKLDLEQIIAKLDEQIRADAFKNEAKVTEKGIASEIELAPKVIDARKELGHANLRVAQWGALKEAYVQRSYAIKDMCGLYASNYFTNQAGSGQRTTQAADNNRRDAGQARRDRS